MTHANLPQLSQHDRDLLRELARRVRDIASTPDMKARESRWIASNRLQTVRPPVLINTDAATEDLVPRTLLRCENPQLHAIEYRLLCEVVHYATLQDDRLVQARWQAPKVFHDTGWGLEARRIASGVEKGAWGFDPVIHKPADLKRLRFPEVIPDEQASQNNLQFAQDLFGDLLDVQPMGVWLVSFHLMSVYCRLRGLEQLFMDMYAAPQMLHDAMAFLEEGHRRLVRWSEIVNEEIDRVWGSSGLRKPCSSSSSS